MDDRVAAFIEVIEAEGTSVLVAIDLAVHLFEDAYYGPPGYGALLSLYPSTTDRLRRSGVQVTHDNALELLEAFKFALALLKGDV